MPIEKSIWSCLEMEKHLQFSFFLDNYFNIDTAAPFRVLSCFQFVYPSFQGLGPIAQHLIVSAPTSGFQSGNPPAHFKAQPSGFGLGSSSSTVF